MFRDIASADLISIQRKLADLAKPERILPTTPVQCSGHQLSKLSRARHPGRAVRRSEDGLSIKPKTAGQLRR